MPFNLDRLQETIVAVRGRKGVETTRIMVGGRIFKEMGELLQLTGADGWAPDAGEAAVLAGQWWEETRK
jgi:hypothetical protein